MDADPLQPDRYQAEIQALIETVEARLEDAGSDRESRLQEAVFAERRERARAMAGRLLAAAGSERPLLEGDALRSLQALQLSREFFCRGGLAAA